MTPLQSGFEVTFIAPRSRRHRGKTVIALVAATARGLGIRQMTQRAADQGSGSNGRLHAAHFFELADQPIELSFVLEPALADRLIDAVAETGAKVFCLRVPLEYGQLGGASDAGAES